MHFITAGAELISPSMVGTGPVWLHSVQCSGTETRLTLDGCTSILQFSSCAHANDVGIRCDTTGNSQLYYS